MGDRTLFFLRYAVSYTPHPLVVIVATPSGYKATGPDESFVRTRGRLQV